MKNFRNGTFQDESNNLVYRNFPKKIKMEAFGRLGLQSLKRKIHYKFNQFVNFNGDRIILGGFSQKSAENTWQNLCKLLRVYKWKNIKSIELTLRNSSNNYDMNEESIKEMSLRVEKYCIRLARLDILFIDFSRVSNKSLESLGFQIGRNNYNLKKLKLGLFKSYSITDSGLKALGYEISQLKGLKVLLLIFTGADKVQDDALKNFVSFITRNLIHLEQLVLNFRDCSKLTDSTLQKIGSGIKLKLTNLKQLALNFSCCKLVTNKGLEFLAGEIANKKPRLDNLVFNFDGCQDDTQEELRNILQKILSPIPNLNIS